MAVIGSPNPGDKPHVVQAVSSPSKPDGSEAKRAKKEEAMDLAKRKGKKRARYREGMATEQASWVLETIVAFKQRCFNGQPDLRKGQ